MRFKSGFRKRCNNYLKNKFGNTGSSAVYL